MSGFLKGLLLSLFASKLRRMAYRRGHGHVAHGLLREVDRHFGRRHRYGRYGHHGHYGYHGHYRRKRW